MLTLVACGSTQNSTFHGVEHQKPRGRSELRGGELILHFCQASLAISSFSSGTRAHKRGAKPCINCGASTYTFPHFKLSHPSHREREEREQETSICSHASMEDQDRCGTRLVSGFRAYIANVSRQMLCTVLPCFIGVHLLRI